jgi:hypothetical protein
MFWAMIVVTGIAGAWIGLRFRVAALIAASALVAVIWVVAGFVSGRPALAVVDVVLAVAALQVGYLLGLLLSCRRGAR